MVDGVEQQIPYREMVIWIVLEGHGSIRHDGPDTPARFKRGNTVLIPAGLKNGLVKTEEDCMWLEVTIPIPSSLAGFERPDRATLANAPSSGRYVPLGVPEQRSSP